MSCPIIEPHEDLIFTYTRDLLPPGVPIVVVCNGCGKTLFGMTSEEVEEAIDGYIERRAELAIRWHVNTL